MRSRPRNEVVRSVAEKISAMSDNRTGDEDRRAAIVCWHVAREGRPIRYARRDENVADVDSGWQFLCGESESEDPDRAKVWLVKEVLDLEPSLAPFIELPAGSVLTRRSPGGEWKVEES